MRIAEDFVIKKRTRALGFIENIIPLPSRQGKTKGLLGVIISNREDTYATPRRKFPSGAKFITAGKLVQV